jgi:hypothetical protein
MRKTTTILACVLALTARAALADGDCLVPMADWQPRAAVAAAAARNGWTLRRIKVDDGCYVIEGTDAAGRPIRARLNPATLEVTNNTRRSEHHD